MSTPILMIEIGILLFKVLTAFTILQMFQMLSYH